MFTVIMSGLGGQEEDSSQWGLDEQDELSKLAAGFKKKDDKTGLYLCALAEEQFNLAQKTGGCGCQAMLYLGMALSHEAGVGDELAHILLPILQKLLRAAVVAAADKGLAIRNQPAV